MTQTALARKIDEHVDWVNTRIRGTVQIKADELPLLAKALNISPCSLLEDEPIAIPEPFRDAFSSPAIVPFPVHQAGGSLGQEWGAYIEERASRLLPHEREAVQHAFSIINALISRAG